MSRYCLPEIRAAAPVRPSAVAVALGRPVVASVTVEGRQGPPGGQGPVGPAGPNLGFGQITYTERTVEPEDSFVAGVRQQLQFDPTTIVDGLNAPFTGFNFWQGNRVVGRAMGDWYDLIVNLIVTAQIAGGQLKIDADVGSTLGPVASDGKPLALGAMVPERVSFRMGVQVQVGFMANGCRLFLTSSVPLTVTSETVVVKPLSIRP